MKILNNCSPNQNFHHISKPKLGSCNLILKIYLNYDDLQVYMSVVKIEYCTSVY